MNEGAVSLEDQYGTPLSVVIVEEGKQLSKDCDCERRMCWRKRSIRSTEGFLIQHVHGEGREGKKRSSLPNLSATDESQMRTYLAK